MATWPRPRHLRLAPDRVLLVAVFASLLFHGSGLYVAHRWGECLCNFGAVVCPKLCDSKRLDLEIANLPPPPTPPKPKPKPTVVQPTRPKEQLAAPKRGRIVLPDEAFAKREKPRAETTARLQTIRPEAALRVSQTKAPMIATPDVFARADDLRAGPPGETGLGGTGQSLDPKANGTRTTGGESGTSGPSPKPTPVVHTPPPPPLPPAPAPAALKGPSRPPRVLDWTDPPYPEQARRQGAEGAVSLRVSVDPSGRPAEVTVAHSSGRDDFDEAAVAHVRKAHFAPALKDGEAASATVMFRVRFRLVVR
jgi:TonB family protein